MKSVNKYSPMLGVEYTYLCINDERYGIHDHYYKIRIGGKLNLCNEFRSIIELPFEVKAGIEALGGYENISPYHTYHMGGYEVMLHKNNMEIMDAE